MAPSYLFNLKVQKVEQICLFELSWGQGQRLTTQVEYPVALTQLYQDWRRAYMNFYQSQPLSQPLRGRCIDGGVAIAPNNWQALLFKAEANLMYEFNHWLQSAELYKIRSTIAAAKVSDKIETVKISLIQIFLTCAPIELDRFPWEAWELGAEFGAQEIQIIRAPLNVGTPQTLQKQVNWRPRILAVLGDDSGLNFQGERNALKSLFRVADVQFVSWQPQQTSLQVVEQITNAIADSSWDILFFAGHSDESEITGGEISVAPGVSVAISQIAQKLSAAIERGLSVAIFNSCSGLNIANTLIDLGLSQVIIMREPIHNSVAIEYMVKFLQGLAKHLDIYESMLEARRYLHTEKNFAYPSSYLVPSLFCHPGATLFRIPPSKSWQQRLRYYLPSPVEAIVIVSTLTLSILTPVQELLLDGRLYVQAAYRNVTKQIPTQTAPVALVQIDTESITKGKLSDSELLPMNRKYIASLIERAHNLNTNVIGLDFVIDTPQKNIPEADKKLSITVQRAVHQKI
ncbi:putative Chase2 sensor protein (plasmid) [Calothrix sp. NIES-4071]|nr:putative Chase2 sensor protein [Calothrix sp. NIES-4071]BAZ65049.1 putative Chase2 sensor protein [Calothrix sp. NIES-4105]